ncbi:MAG: hypothetical protein A2Y33_04605 [Spirochaetes bacterium GWF1_51_8]|nr:MAG: hypothetical protein A2Y33_04605 [Spirochaetes bacterium GWF1_51_8]
MSTSDDFSVLKTPEYIKALENFGDLMNQDGRVFLLGAGCSYHAGCPLMQDLTSGVLKGDGLDEDSKKVLEGIKSIFSGANKPNIEDYLSEIIDHLAISERRDFLGSKNTEVYIQSGKYTKFILINAIEQIKQSIAKAIRCEGKKPDLSIYRQFVISIHQVLRPGKIGNFRKVDYVYLNYDSFLEDALSLEKISFTDGMNGGSVGWWEPKMFDREDYKANILKIHGSIEWCEFESDPFPRRIPERIIDNPKNRKILIWPASTKYRETQRDPFAELIKRFRDILTIVPGKQIILTICGYSFNDSHINIEIEQALKESDGRLTLVVFTSDNEPLGDLKKWNENEDIGKQILIYAKNGFFHYPERYPSTVDLPWWKFENVTRIIGGEK